MTDAIRALTVVLDPNIRAEDVEPLRQAISRMQGVRRVSEHLRTDLDRHLVREAQRGCYTKRLLALWRGERGAQL